MRKEFHFKYVLKHTLWMCAATSLLLTSACTNKANLSNESKFAVAAPASGQTIAANVIYKHDIQFNGGTTQVYRMKIKNGALYVTGRPFLLSSWNLQADPLVPTLSFAAADNINQFSQNSLYGPPVFDWIAQGAIEWFGSHLITSGTAGSSVVDISQTHNPVEVFRNPSHANNNHTVNSEFVYKAIVNHPTLPLGYGFREQDFIMTFNTNFPQISKRQKLPYSPSGNICCVKGAEYFDNKIYVAAQKALMIYELGDQGQFVGLNVYEEINPVAVVATPNFIYVHHQPVSNSTSPYATGIYAFNRLGEAVQYFKLDPLVFAISEDDRYAYANETDEAISIYELDWRSARSQ